MGQDLAFKFSLLIPDIEAVYIIIICMQYITNSFILFISLLLIQVWYSVGLCDSILKFTHYDQYWRRQWQPTTVLLPGKIPWMEEPGGLQSMGSLGVRHDWAPSLSLFTFMHWRREWQPTPVFLPGESQGRGSLVGCCLWGRTESDTTEVT